MNIASLFRGLLGDSRAGEAKSMELKEGQVVRGVVLSVSDTGKEALVQIQGMPVRAELETPLQPGQAMNLQVGPAGEGGLPVLKAVSLGEAAMLSPQSMGEALESLGLTNSKAGKEIIQAMQAGGLAMTKETAAKLDTVLNAKPQGVPTSEWLEAAVISVKRGLPVTAESVRGLQQAVFGPKLHELLSNLEAELGRWAQQESEVAKASGSGAAAPAPEGLGKPLASAGTAAPANGSVPVIGTESEAAEADPAASRTAAANVSVEDGGDGPKIPKTAGNIPANAGKTEPGNAGTAMLQAGSTDSEPDTGAAVRAGAAAMPVQAEGEAASNAALPKAGNTELSAAPKVPAAGTAAQAPGGSAAAGSGAAVEAAPAGASTRAAEAAPAGASTRAAEAAPAGASTRGAEAAPAGASTRAADTALAGASTRAADAGKGTALLAKLQGVLTELRGTLPQLATAPPAAPAGTSPSPAATAPQDEAAPPAQAGQGQAPAAAPRGEGPAAAQPGTAATQDTESWVGRVLKLLGAEHEQQAVRGGAAAAALQGAAGGGENAADTLKGLLLQAIGSSEVPPAVKEAAGSLVQQLTGQQLLLNTDRTAPFAQVTLFLPFRGEDGQETASVHIQSRRGRKGELDAANCRLWFDLDMKQLGQTMVDVQVVDRIVSLKLHNDTPWVLELLEGRREDIAAAVESVGYQLSGLRTEPLPELGAADASPAVSGLGKLADYVPDAYKGVDYRI